MFEQLPVNAGNNRIVSELLSTAVGRRIAGHVYVVAFPNVGLIAEVYKNHAGIVCQQEASCVISNNLAVCRVSAVLTCENGGDIGRFGLFGIFGIFGIYRLIGIGLCSRRLCSRLLGSRRLCSRLLGSRRLCGRLLGSGRLCSRLLGSRRLCSRFLGSGRLGGVLLGAFLFAYRQKACVNAHVTGKRSVQKRFSCKGLFPNAVVPVPATENVAFFFGVGGKLDCLCTVGGDGIIHFAVYDKGQLEFYAVTGYKQGQ